MSATVLGRAMDRTSKRIDSDAPSPGWADQILRKKPRKRYDAAQTVRNGVTIGVTLALGTMPMGTEAVLYWS